MLIYLESKVFPNKTFVLVVNQYDRIARARAQMMHVLYELGKPDHQFRLRFKGNYLRDAHTFENYNILDSSVIKMVPMAKSMKDEFIDAQNVALSSLSLGEGKKPQKHKDEAQLALDKEVKIFGHREKFFVAFRVLLWIHILGCFLSLLTVYRYSAVWTAILVFYGFHYCPYYTRVGGYVGKVSFISKRYFLLTFGIGAVLNLVASILMGVFLMLDIIKHGCAEFIAECSYLNVWSVCFYYGQSVFFIGIIAVTYLLFQSITVEVGDIIEKYLIQNKDVTKVMKMARLGRPKERRNAAFELASLAASGEENKQKIVGEGGLQVLMNLALGNDESTQEYATEALAELLVVPSIQDQFIDMGGARTLCALLHSRSERLVFEAAMTISFIVSDSENNRKAIADEEGLEDLSHAAYKGSMETGRLIATILLELSFDSTIRERLATQELAVSTLVHLIKSNDSETQRLALQTIELLAIENAEIVIEKEELLHFIVNIPSISEDEQLYLLAGKILIYYAESESACRKIIEIEGLKDSLLQFAMSPDPVIQNVVARVILSMVENSFDQKDILCIGIIEVLAYLHDNCQDRNAWEIAEKAIDLLHELTLRMQKKQDADPSTSSLVEGSVLTDVKPMSF
ncbi:uncharacterized protein LOC135688341 [Rhopilema esculentum]|uniref:uncharacterized protein LOC135688341 n=1 Tax=Rhopilema esculentum TaxID=499914 RepID=UPI0031E39941